MKQVRKIQTIVYRGYNHADFCEDFLVHYESEDFLVCAVMDGCSGSIHAHFASSLFGKIFNLLLRSENGMKWASDMEPLDIACRVMCDFSSELIRIQHQLRMGSDELMSTIVFAVYSKKKDKLIVIPFGDGFVMVNGQGHLIENNTYPDTIDDNGKVKRGKSKPDYIIHHAYKIFSGSDRDNSGHEHHEWVAQCRSNFQNWFIARDPIFEFHDVNDFSISSDGIWTFMTNSNQGKSDEAIDLLMRDTKMCGGLDDKANLSKKMNVMYFRYKAKNADDLAMIRVILQPEPVKADSVMSKEAVQ